MAKSMASSSTPVVDIPEVVPSRRQHQHLSSRGRAARLASPAYLARRADLLKGVGGAQGYLSKLLAGPTALWADMFPGPHHDGDTMAAFDMWFEAANHGDQHSLIAEWAEAYGVPGGSGGNFVVPFAKFGWGLPFTPCHMVIVNHPEDHEKAEVDEAEWKRRRFGAIYTVAPDFIKSYFHRMERHADILSSKFESGESSTFVYGGVHTPAPVFNVHEMLVSTAFAIAADCLFNLDDVTIAAWSRKIRWALMLSDPKNAQSVKILRDWKEMVQRIPTEKQGPLIKALHELKEDHPSSRGYSADKAFHDDLHILTLAMHDTTGATMTWLIMELARRPVLQAQVAAEADSVLAEAKAAGRALTYDDLYKMPLLTRCLNETLRLYPAVSYGTQRTLSHDETLHCGPGPDDVCVVPAGTVCAVPSFTNHRRKDLWGPDADQWRPERWDGFGDEGSFGFLDDGESYKTVPRDCFGKNFAQAEIRVVLPVLLSRFKFELAEPTRSTVAALGPEAVAFQLTGILKPRDGLWVHAIPRAVPTAKL